MTRISLHQGLAAARRAKSDEFYTHLVDIERELRHYRNHFKGKVVYCNCDDPYVSAFFEYFTKNFEFLEIKKLITTCYKSQQMDLFSRNDSGQAIKLEYLGGAPNSLPTPDDIGITPLKGDGDFRSAECIELLKQADIVVTNPPFSLFREYVAQLVEHAKKFVIIGPKNAITYKDVFPLIKANKIWVGATSFNKDILFIAPSNADLSKKPKTAICEVDGVTYLLSPSVWFTNLDHGRYRQPLPLMTMEDNRRFNKKILKNENSYLQYDNYNAIEVPYTNAVPSDYGGVMGVPITFLDKHNPEQFEIIGATESEGKGLSNGLWKSESGATHAVVNGKRVYKRLFIRNRSPISLND